MSKIGEMPISIESVEIRIDDNQVEVKGSEGVLTLTLSKEISVEKKDQLLILKRLSKEKKAKALHGLYRALIQNAVLGVSKPWEKRLEVVGTGYKVKLQGEDLVFEVGFSHPVIFKSVPGIKFSVEGNNKLAVKGCNKQIVGQVAQKIREIKDPDPYKGKGLRYEGEKIKLKPGKKAKTVGVGAK